MKFPGQGELFPSPNKKYQELVFFVLFYNGTKKKLNKHIELVNDLGFDAFIFQIHNPTSLFDLPVTANLSFGLQHRIAEQIENLLNLLPQQKIIYAFSGPSHSAIEAIARRQASDVKALVCDSGPTNEFLKSMYNLLEHEYQFSLPRRLIQWPLISMMWNPTLQTTLHEDLKKFPKNFKVLSIRGWKDKLVSASDIDAAFEPHSQLDWQKLSLPQASHVQGLKTSPNEYRHGVEKFLKEVATPI